MAAYDVSAWHDLFVMLGGASAALAGLLFVAVSVNSDEILAEADLPSLAYRAVTTLIALLLVSGAALAPGQSSFVLGIEFLTLGVILSVALWVPTVRELRRPIQTSWKLNRSFVTVASSVPIVVAGASLMAGTGGGLFWMLGELAAGLVASTYYAWVLLIEIRR